MTTPHDRQLWAEPTPEPPTLDAIRQAIQRDTGCGAFTAHHAAWLLEQGQQGN